MAKGKKRKIRDLPSKRVERKRAVQVKGGGNSGSKEKYIPAPLP
jgi:hypothetical protein